MSESGQRAPSSGLNALLRTTVEAVANRALALDPASLERCARMVGKHVRFEVDGLGLALDLGFAGDGIYLADGHAVEPDTVIGGTPMALLGMLGGRGPDALFSGEVRMQGDTLLGKRLHRLFGAVEIDWEEQLSRVTGDLVAHKVFVGLRDAEHWGRRSAESLALDLGEYLQEETGLLATRAEVDSLVEAIDRFGADVDRLEARLRLLAAAD